MISDAHADRNGRPGDLMTLAKRLSAAALGASLFALAGGASLADPVRHPTAVFAGLDKITGRIINFDVAINETVQFGTLQVTPRVCNTRPQTELPQTTTFVEVDEQAPKPDQRRDPNASARTEVKYETKRIFSGWMFAGSPGLHGVEHPVYDVWLVDCKGGKEVAPAQAAAGAPNASQTPDAQQPPKPEGEKRRRARRVEPKAPTTPEAQPIGPADEPVFNPNQGGGDAAAPAQPDQPQPQRRRERRRRNAAPAGGAPGAAPAPAAPAPAARDPFGLF
jgi:hypothetical protein